MTFQSAMLTTLLTITINSGALTPGAVNHPTPIGNWLTEDGSAIVSIGACEEGRAELCGIITSLLNAQDSPEVLAYSDELCGLPVLWDLQPSGQKWTNGKILEVETEQIYDAQISLKNGALIVRAFEGIPAFGESVTWTRVTEFVPCKDENSF